MSIKRVIRGGPGHDEHYGEFLMESAADVAILPNANGSVEERATPGSLAYTEDLSKNYMLGVDGTTWTEV